MRFGGVFAVLGKTGAIESGIQRLAGVFARKPRSKKFVIPVLMIVFSLAGAIYGMAEESIPFAILMNISPVFSLMSTMEQR